MDFVDDIQCLKNSKNSVVPKEIAAVALNGDYTAYWIIAPTDRIESLPDKVRKQNDWLTQNHHGLDYFEGAMSKKLFYQILREICKQVRKIYVRGKEKWLPLHRLTLREIINLKYDKNCALNNAYRLKNWLRSRSSNINAEFDSSSPLQLCDEQSADIEKSGSNTLTYCGLPSRSDPKSVHKTDSVCF